MIKFTYIILITIFCFSTGCAEKEIQIEGNLNRLFIFANGDDDFLMNPVSMATDKKSAIFVTDNYPSQVKKYSLEGEFLQIIGSRGQSPDAYLHPGAIDVFNDRFFVTDSGNRRLKIQSLNGEIEHIFIHRYALLDIAVGNNTIFTFSPPALSHHNNLEELKLITAYDFEGNEINSFGEYITDFEGVMAGLSWTIMKVEDNLLHVVFKYFPLYRVYSLEGQLLYEFDLSPHLAPKSDESKFQTDSNTSNHAAVFRAFDIVGQNVFIAHQNNYIKIDEFSFNDGVLDFIGTHTFNDGNTPNVVTDFFYYEESESFYIKEYRHGEGLTQIAKYQQISEN